MHFDRSSFNILLEIVPIKSSFPEHNIINVAFNVTLENFLAKHTVNFQLIILFICDTRYYGKYEIADVSHQSILYATFQGHVAGKWGVDKLLASRHPGREDPGAKQGSLVPGFLLYTWEHVGTEKGFQRKAAVIPTSGVRRRPAVPWKQHQEETSHSRELWGNLLLILVFDQS